MASFPLLSRIRGFLKMIWVFSFHSGFEADWASPPHRCSKSHAVGEPGLGYTYHQHQDRLAQVCVAFAKICRFTFSSQIMASFQKSFKSFRSRWNSSQKIYNNLPISGLMVNNRDQKDPSYLPVADHQANRSFSEPFACSFNGGWVCIRRALLQIAGSSFLNSFLHSCITLRGDSLSRSHVKTYTRRSFFLSKPNPNST